MLTLGLDPGRDKIYGRADVSVRALIEKGLRAVRDDARFRRHTSVKRPELSDADEAKRLRKQLCLELSTDPETKLLLPDSPITRAATFTE